MRINVYAEELTDEVEIVVKNVTDDENGTRTFYGLRFYLKSPDDLHHSDEDDDRSAITIWGGDNVNMDNFFQLIVNLRTAAIDVVDLVDGALKSEDSEFVRS